MILPGREIVSMIHERKLEDVLCRFSIPRTVYEDSRKRKYVSMLDISESAKKQLFERHTKGEKLTDLAHEIGTHPSYLSRAFQTYLKKLAREKRSRA